MAAEKLTPTRFAQIIIMLTLLIAVFTWRTLSYFEQDNLECYLTPKCTVNINDSSLIAYLEGSILIVYKPVDDWTMKSMDPSLEVQVDDYSWKVKLLSQQDIEFYFKSAKNDEPIKVQFHQ
ncbi:hypothetical protein [Vibrio hepatarius]|uniref:hypothetical protein n=1 Tax=Vibrio hepatarius TaxID=171383 RepID=UPI001C081ADA|nr:hypothetical protein [Vibrio hepatarius]MBU2898934.1 hypothetical protein [Vibrio hepatarius]